MSTSDEDRARLVSLWIRELSSKLGSHRVIADAVGVTNGTVTRWSQGRVGDMKLRHLIKLGELSDHTVGDLLVAFYGVTPEELIPKSLITRADQMAVPEGTPPAPRNFRLVFLFPEDDQTRD